MRFTIDDNFAIRMYADGDEVPFIYQPFYPHGEPFLTYEEAENWALAKKEELENPNSEFLAGPNRLLPRERRNPPAETIRESLIDTPIE